MIARPQALRTSQVLHLAASELAALAGPSSAVEALIVELRLRARWIEGARADKGISTERRRGIATIEDTNGESMTLRCTAEGKCTFHRDGGSPDDACPGQCDALGCTLDGHYEVGADHVVCAVHGAIVLLARAVSEALAADNTDNTKAVE